MKVPMRTLLIAEVIVMALLGQGAHATEAVAVLNLEGNPSCSQLATNTILAIKDTSPGSPTNPETVTGPGGQQITYTIQPGDTVFDWHSTAMPHPLPVNFVLLKASGNVGSRAFLYRAGATSDTFLQAPGTIAQISFCYGFAQSLPPLTTCDPTIPCQDDQVVITLDPAPPQWGVEKCSCGTFIPCDPALEAGTDGACKSLCDSTLPPGTPGACCDPTLPPGTLGACEPFVPVPVDITAGQDPWVCFTIGGKRKCYCQDRDSVKPGCQ